MTDRTAGYLGLAMRSGSVFVGAGKAAEAVTRGKAGLVVIDALAAENTTKKLIACCRSNGTPCCILQAGTLGPAIGRVGVYAAALLPGELTRRIAQACADNIDQSK